MKLRIPSYYRNFQCSADKCSDSCCIGWEIDLDEDTYDYYCQVSGKFGERLRSRISDGEEKSFILNGERCPFLNDRNLCDIYSELGETALCEICTEYPRFTLEYGNVREKCLGLSCEEAGKLILLTSEPFCQEEFNLPEMYEMEEEFCQTVPAADEEKFVKVLEKSRDKAISILTDRKMSIGSRLCIFLRFSEQVQTLLEENQFEEIEKVIRTYKNKELELERLTSDMAKKDSQSYFEDRIHVFQQLEVLGEEWISTLDQVSRAFSPDCISNDDYISEIKAYQTYIRNREYELEQLLVYFTFRYFMKAVFDGDLLGKAKFAVVSFLMIRDMDVERFLKKNNQFEECDRVDTARIYSKEVEHSEENLAFLAQVFQNQKIFETDELIKQIGLLC